MRTSIKKAPSEHVRLHALLLRRIIELRETELVHPSSFRINHQTVPQPLSYSELP